MGARARSFLVAAMLLGLAAVSGSLADAAVSPTATFSISPTSEVGVPRGACAFGPKCYFGSQLRLSVLDPDVLQRHLHLDAQRRFSGQAADDNLRSDRQGRHNPYQPWTTYGLRRRGDPVEHPQGAGLPDLHSPRSSAGADAKAHAEADTEANTKTDARLDTNSLGRAVRRAGCQSDPRTFP